MSRILRIVAKDARHLWPEILLGIGIVAAFAALEPSSWPGHYNNSDFRQASDLRGLVQLLLPLSWWLLIARSVQDESLVGDRQFWITRPYGWQRILAAKLIFICVFVALPLFLAKAWLLHYAGLSPFANLFVLFLNMLATATLVFLPLFAIAVVTANLVRMFFLLLAGCLFVGLVAYIYSLFPSRPSFGPDTTPFWVLPLTACVMIAVILLQYARRRTMIARVTLIVLCIALATFASVRANTWTPHRVYSEQTSAEPLPFTLELNPDRSLLGPPPVANEDGKFLLPPDPENPAVPAQEYKGRISIPIVFANIPTNHAVRIDNFAISYKSLLSGKQEVESIASGQTFLPGEISRSLNVSFGDSSYRMGKDQPLVINLTIAATEFETTGAASSTISDRDFSVPNGGICHPTNDEKHLFALDNCQYPLDSLPTTLVTARWSDQPCGQTSSSGQDGLAWIGGDGTWGLRLDFDPVQNLFVYLSGAQRDVGKGHANRFLCPGTSVKFTNFRVTRRRLVHVTLPPILPRDYTKAEENSINVQRFIGVDSYSSLSD